jgi:hypothetical protein
MTERATEPDAEHVAALVRAQVAYYGAALMQHNAYSLGYPGRLRAFLLGAMWAEIGRHLNVKGIRR